MNILVVVDMQNDFINGTLGTEEAVKIVPKVIEKIKTFNGKIWATRDTHEENYLETQEGRKLPIKHCVRNTEGWEINREIQKLLLETPIDKGTFGSRELIIVLQKYAQEEKLDSITLVGLCTDICVISNAILLKTYFPETSIIVDASCCAGVTPQSHQQALETMKMCQIEVVGQ
ncbi:cysteine hydrolase family protein [Faecalimonas sp.]